LLVVVRLPNIKDIENWDTSDGSEDCSVCFCFINFDHRFFLADFLDHPYVRFGPVFVKDVNVFFVVVGFQIGPEKGCVEEGHRFGGFVINRFIFQGYVAI